MTQIVALPRGRTASYEVIGSGRPALMFAGGPGFSAAYMNGDGNCCPCAVLLPDRSTWLRLFHAAGQSR